MPFKILFKINSLVQHGCLPGPALNANFFRLVDPNRINMAYIEHALDKLSHLQKCCYDPTNWLSEQYEKYLMSGRLPKSPAIALDNELVYVRKVLVTPSKIYFRGPEIRLSNRVLRSYPNEIDNFICVSFVDENLDKLNVSTLCPWIFCRNEELHTQRTRVYQRIISTLRNGIAIGDKKFETLAFSNSQLKNNSLWMFAFRPGLTSADIREQMGDFREIKNLITLLSALGIQDCVFERKQKEFRYKLNAILRDPLRAHAALELISSWENTNFLKEMLICCYRPDEEPFLSMMLQTFRASALLDLRTKTKIFVQDGLAMMGCLDETGDFGICGNGSVQHKIVEGRLVVSKNPCLHPGDVRVLRAVNVPALHHMVNCIVFPSKGKRPHPNECSGSDLDGDIYFVCWDPDLIPPCQFPPMEYTPAPTKNLDDDVTMEDIEEFFADYTINDNLGVICNTHVVFADKEPDKAISNQCLELAALFSIAVDFSKTTVHARMPQHLRVSKYPDFMDKADNITYKSQSVIGKLYRQVKAKASIKPFTEEMAKRSYDDEMEVDGFKDYINDAFYYKSMYDSRLGSLMHHYAIKTEAEILSGCVLEMASSLDKYKDWEAVAWAVSSLISEARAWFNNNKRSESESSCEADNLYAKASAWYYVTYHPSYWGRHNEEMNGAHFISFPWCTIHGKLIAIKRAKLTKYRY
ncbi:hypothetical protein Patl1_19785 [Pistacia atlantica]|uniref:Uncharacterized protein n=1 Tax=Pistacia atlantica TaxID=434234 RepID=A0ACC1BJM3_9ROSI|nr:hypothetical protein Patl1_19785 [Pistacia atlantica]